MNNNSENNNGKGFKSFLCSKAGKVGMIIVFYGIIFGLLLLVPKIFGSDSSGYVALVFAVLLGYFGWQALNKITPDIFLFMPLVGWLIYFLVKGMLSVVVGIFVAPFVISKKIVAVIERNI